MADGDYGLALWVASYRSLLIPLCSLVAIIQPHPPTIMAQTLQQVQLL